MKATTKPNEEQIRRTVDTRARQLIEAQGPDFSDQAVFEAFSEWVLPDRHLTLIRERVERWRGIARRRGR